ncbi:SixA phosphatase family protein [Colwellia sp. 12G3]|uniref:SixA phosphatase family protein n=1 Tax=Colwellia sp. 12G3 TaxID=2058299 RepID=UPI000C3386B1|nr:histidine phosphatase family protein [Colwellia sp. 12G3]PKI17763.1 histidine phosphatase family protein [Colwellia sp. 12G3]
MIKFSILMISSLLLKPCLASDNFTLYLVRHAEKQTDSKNPALTQCGKERAKQLATLLSTANIKSIYSTSYQRTLSTAAPLSNAQKIAIKNYNPQQLEQFSLHLKQRKENALIVGHSNTTPQLTQLLSNHNVAELSEKEFQNLYQIQFIEGESLLTKLMQPHECKSIK